jgi:Mg2+ and Co2+ transporter CorA
MSEDTKSVSQGNVEINVEKYTQMVLKLDEANDKIREMEKLSKELQIATAAAKPKEKFSFGALFRDENDINEKSIIGFASFSMMLAFGIVDLVTGFWGMDLKISDTIYTSFVVVTLGSFGIAEAGKAFSKQ